MARFRPDEVEHLPFAPVTARGRKGGERPADDRATAVILCRAPCVHDSRILREADTLTRIGYDPLIVGVVSEEVRGRRGTEGGFPILRLAPGSPFSWLRRRLRRGGGAGSVPVRSGSAHGQGRGVALAIRAHRWLRTLDFYRRAIAMVASQRPALVHCNDYNTMWVGVAARLWGAAGRLRRPRALARSQPASEPRWWLLACEALFVRAAHRTITASPGYAEVMARRYRIGPRVIRNIPDSDSVPRSPAALRRRSDRLVYVGALTTGPRAGALDQGPGPSSDVAPSAGRPGPAAYRAELVELARTRGSRTVSSSPAPSRPRGAVETISGASVGLALIQPICLSYRMSLPNKLFEYVAAGLPVLGSDLPAIGGLVNEQRIGLLAEPGEVRTTSQRSSARCSSRSATVLSATPLAGRRASCTGTARRSGSPRRTEAASEAAG